MKKVKTWFKEHKKEIIVGAVAAGGTALYFLFKDKKINIKTNGISLTLRLLNNELEDREDVLGYRRRGSNSYASLNMNNPDITLKDMGKLGEMIKEKFPMITKETKIDYLSVSHDIFKE